jgi:hypothetical protein
MKNQKISGKKIKGAESKTGLGAKKIKTVRTSVKVPVLRFSSILKKKATYGPFNSILPGLTVIVIGISILAGVKLQSDSQNFAGNEKLVSSALNNNVGHGHGNNEYMIEWNSSSGKYESENPANGMKFNYDKDGFTAQNIKSDVSTNTSIDVNNDWKITLRLDRVSKDSDAGVDIEMNKCEISADGNKAVAENDKIRIDYLNSEKGMRQDFTIKERPVGNENLELFMTVNSDLRFTTREDEVVFTDERGIAVMKYSSLKVWDAGGKILSAGFRENNNSRKGFSIYVDDTEAEYPVTVDPLSASPSTVLTGPYSFGSAANPAGDVNGDGYDDVIVGAKEATINMTNDGKVSLFYGTSSGLSTAPSWYVTGDTSNTAFGHSVASAGDVNDDGYDDILIGNPGYKVAGVSRGRALLYLGSASGPDTIPSWTAIGYTISDLGRSVYSAGDVNNDGYDDILLSTAYASFGGTHTGAVYMYFGSATGPDTIPDWEVRGDNPFQNFGNSVCTAGDVNGDGYDDVIIGAHDYSSSSGAVYAFYGSASGLSASPNWTKTGAATGNKFGNIVYKAGDVNGDGFGDVVIGEPNTSSPGKAYVFHGSSSGLAPNANWTATGSAKSFGRSAATAGDYNGDGFSDIIVGMSDSSELYVYKGSSAGLSANSVWSYTGDGTVTVLGFNVATAGDVNGDGYSDVMGAGYSPKVYIFNGSMDSGNVVVSGAVARNGEYETLADAFSAINSNTQTGATITVTVKGNTNEPATGAMLNANSWNSLTLIPSGNRTVSGTTGYNSPLITLNGADNVVFDGLNSEGNSLTFSNSNAVIYYEGITLSLKNDASNNTVKRCSILGSGIISLYYDPAVIFFGTGNTSGNDNNVISECNISTAGANLPVYGIRSSGSTANEAMFNSGDTIRDCHIYDFFNADRSSSGVSVYDGSTNFVIKNNRFYQTAPRTINAFSSSNKAIEISNTSGNDFHVTGNIIGHSNPEGTGTYGLTVSNGSAFVPIDLSAGNASTSEISGNLIRSIVVTGTSLVGSNFTGIQVTNGNVNITENEIGDSTSTSSIDITGWSGNNSSAYGIKLSGSGNCTTNGNSIFGFRYTRTNSALVNHIVISSALSGNWNCENNIVGSSLANSISNTSTNTNTVTNGIQSLGGTAFISGNIIRNLNTSGGTIYSSQPPACFTGIHVAGGANNTVSKNIIHTLTNTNPDTNGNGGAGIVTGVYLNGSGMNIAEKNFVHSLFVNSRIGQITGIRADNGTNAVRNNMIRLGVDASGNGINFGLPIYGIHDFSGTNNFNFNSVFLGGNPKGPYSSGTYCVYSNSTSSVRNYYNNILYNARSNNGSTGIHATFRSDQLASFSSNYNILFAPGAGGIIGYSLGQKITIANWRSFTGQDLQSQNSNPQFVNPSGNSASLDLHISASVPTPAERNGILIDSIADDYDDQIRASFTPTDIGAVAGNFVQYDTAVMSISYSLIPSANNSEMISFSNVTITDANGVNGTAGTRPRVYYKKLSDANVINDNTSSTAGWKYSEANNSASPFNFTILFSRLNSAIVQTDTIQYFVVAQDLASIPHVGINTATFSQYPFTVNLTSQSFPVSGSINRFTFQNFNVIVSGAVTGNGFYGNLASAFTALNSGVQTSADINVQIVGNTTEPATGATLNENDWNSFSVTPSGDTARTVSGAVTGGLPLINLNGADRVKIDGLDSGGISLTLINTTFSFSPGTSTINFKSDASYNVVTNCTILSSAAVHQSFDGGAVNFATGTATGNNFNVVSHCNISRYTSGQVTKGIAFLGSTLATAYNKGDTIRNCNFYNYGYGPVQSGVAVLSGNTNIVIKDNRFHQTSAVTLNPDAQHSAIRIESPLGSGFEISGNIIGYSSDSATGKYTVTGSNTARFQPILVHADSSAVSNIQGNSIAEIAMSGSFSGTTTNAPFIGILVTSGRVNIGNIAGNEIGSQTATQSITLTSTSTSNTAIVGIHTASTAPCNTSGNSVGGLYGIASSSGSVGLFGTKNTSTGNWICQNNIFGGSIANSMQTTSAATSTIVIGIQNTGRNSTITGNTVRNFTTGGGNAGVYAASAMGILVNPGSATHTVTGNTIHSISSTNTTQANILSGILVNGTSTGNMISGNLIRNITALSPVATVNGIQISNGNSTYSNNMISLGSGVNPGCTIHGIYETGGSNNVYHNSVLLNGNPTANSGYSYSFRSTQFGNIRNFVNNSFFNSRSNSGSTGKHYAISIAGISQCYSNNNLLFADGTGGILGLLNSSEKTTLAEWLSATGLDSNSVTGNPNYISDSDLHIDTSQSSPVGNAGRNIASVTDDIDGDIRSLNTPDIGADEFNSQSQLLQLNLTVFFEGFYNAGTDSQVNDTVRVYLRNSSSPYQAVDSAKAIADVNGSAVLMFANAPSDTYYVALAHRNTIETWSASPIAMTNGDSANYNMSVSIVQAFGNNLIQVDNSPVRFALFSGDANQDGTVDATDLSIIDNDAANFSSGYLPTDINGDDFIDGTDFAIADNNAANFISVIEP